MFTLEISDQAVRDALQELRGKVANLQPILQRIGEGIMERSKQRFATSTGPDGQRWKPNTQTTLQAFIASKGGFGKRGINKKGMGLAMSKKPLIGPSGDLRRQFHVSATPTSVTLSNSMVYAAIQQFGGTKAQFPHLWGDIPARPFLPIKQSGELYPADQAKILEMLRSYLAES